MATKRQPPRAHSIGTQVVSLDEVCATNGGVAHPAGAVGVITAAPPAGNYRVRFMDGVEATLPGERLRLLADHKSGGLTPEPEEADPLRQCVIYRCVVGSRAFGLADEDSDVDRRGLYVPPADRQWSLYGVPEQLEYESAQEVYWEVKKFLVLALKGNPNILECLFTPLVEFATPLAEELLALRDCFVSKLIFQTFNGYVISQFKRSQSDLRARGRVKPKHAMHLIRLLLSGIQALETGRLMIDVGRHRERLLEIKRGDMTWDAVESWRQRLHAQFAEAFQRTRLPDRPDDAAANAFLIKARRAALDGGPCG